MLKEDLESLLDEARALGNDNVRVEAKKARGGLPTKLWETLSAFANSGGGVLLLGVDEADDFRAVGVLDPGSMEDQLGAICSTQLSPPVRAHIDTVDLDGSAVVVVEVPALPRTQRPCHYVGAGPYGGSYIRVADGDRQLSQYEVSVLLADRGQPRDDERPVIGADRDSLRPDLVSGYLETLSREKPKLFASGDETKVLQQAKVLVDDGSGSLVPSVAGLLALGDYPQEFLPQANLTFVLYPGVERGVTGPQGERFADNASFEGPIPEITAEVLGRLRSRMARRSIVSGIGRQDVYEYPEEALREAIVNALAHRDLSANALGTQVQIEMFSDRLEIKNPGGLHGPVNAEDLPTSATSSARNASLYKILEHVPHASGRGAVCENRGSGIKSMIISLRQAGMNLPIFEDDIAYFKVVFPNAALLDDETVAWLGRLGEKSLSDSQVFALARMRKGETLKNASYRAQGALDSRVAGAELRDLVERKLVEVAGTRGGATYSLANRLTVAAETDNRTFEKVPEVAKEVFEALQHGPLRRKDLEARLQMPANQVLYRLRTLRQLDLVEPTGSTRSPRTAWRLR